MPKHATLNTQSQADFSSDSESRFFFPLVTPLTKSPPTLSESSHHRMGQEPEHPRHSRSVRPVIATISALLRCSLTAWYFLKPRKQKPSTSNAGKATDSRESPKAVSEQTQTVLYSMAVSFINNEAQLIWSRYNIMLAANSFITVLLGALVVRGAPTVLEASVVLIGSMLGLFLSWQWRGLTKRGWELEHYWVKYAETFKWQGIQNPLDPYSEWCKKTGRGEGLDDWISLYARRVIWLFIVGYSVAVIAASAILFIQIIGIRLPFLN